MTTSSRSHRCNFKIVHGMSPHGPEPPKVKAAVALTRRDTPAQNRRAMLPAWRGAGGSRCNVAYVLIADHFF